MDEGIFLRELYAIMYKWVEIGECYRFVLYLYVLPLCGEASIVPASWIKENDWNHPATKEMEKPFDLGAGSVAVVEAMAKQKARKRKQTGTGEATKKKRNSCQIRPFSLHYAPRLDESRQSQFIAKIMATSLTFLQTTWLSFAILYCWRKKWTVSRTIYNTIAGFHVTSRRPCWWSRTKVFLSSGN